MAMLLGKRKRRASFLASSDSLGEEDGQARLQALLQAHYERTYEPLAPQPAVASDGNGCSYDGAASSASEESWSGMSEGGDGHVVPVQVVEDHAERPAEVAHDEEEAKAEARAFMSAKPPSGTAHTANGSTPTGAAAAPHPEDAADLVASDLALQRLLAESHLLAPPAAEAATGATRSRSSRHAATALRLAALGAVPAKAPRVPMAQRQGIERARRAREAERRAEAREAGAVLERKGGQRERRGRRKGERGPEREREIGGPAVGRWRGGTLVLGRKDVRAIRRSESTAGKTVKTGKRRR